MKKIKFILPLLGFLAIGCTDILENVNEEKPSLSGNDEVKGYISVSVAGARTPNTRATYEDGSSSENYVNMIRFYMFDNDGEPVYIRTNPNQDSSAPTEHYSYYDWDVTANDNANAGSNSSATVEKVLTTTMLLVGPDDYEFPENMQILAVVNPPQSVLSLGNASLSDVRAAIADYKTNLTSSNFVMSNSVFIDGDGEMIYAQPFETAVNIAPTIKQSQENPLVIYVERVVSRVDLGINLVAEENGSYDTTVEYDPIDPEGVPEGTYTGEIYVKINNWAVTSTPNKSYLVKSIDTEWPSDLFGNLEIWNSSDYHRSFWAINPLAIGESPLENIDWFSFNEIKGNGLAIPTGTTKVSAYAQENANPFITTENAGTGANPKYPTKVILTGTLVDAEGNPITIAEYNQQHFTLDGLMNFIAGYLNMWTLEGGKYTTITPDDLQLVTKKNWVSEDEFPAPDVNGTYFVYFVLTEEAAAKTWYHQVENTTTYTVITDPKTYIYDSVGRAMVWNGGMTYYYFDIEHLGNAGFPGYTGVVRNHIYDCAVSSLVGLGTPVWDPDETIYPEKPNRSGNLLTVEINILQWRLVKKSFDLAW